MSTKLRSEPRSIVSPGNSIMISNGDETYQITKDDKRFARVEALVKQKKWSDVFSILGAIRDIKAYSEGNIVIEGEEVLYKGTPVNSYIADKILKMVTEGNSDYEPLARFLDKIMESQFPHVRENLYKFLEYGNIPITTDGDFLGYKSVKSDYMDVYSGTFDNTPGNIVRMERKTVVSDPSQGCSAGLHVGVKQYVSGFGGARTIIVKVDPRNVVSVPSDYSFQKMRTCEYYVVADYKTGEPLTSEVYDVECTPANAPVATGNGPAKVPSTGKGLVKLTIPMIIKQGTIKPHIAPKVHRLRDANGRFIKKKPAPRKAVAVKLKGKVVVKPTAKKGPARDAKGHFIKRR